MEGAGQREVSLVLTDDREIHELNQRFRNKDKPTDVLSFGYDDPHVLGDIIISVERARAQAESRNVTLDSELELLAVHGALHLLGYDHAEPQQAKLMRKRTRQIRRRL